MVLQGLDIHLHYYKPGKANSDVDALSCDAIPETNNLVVPWKVLTAIKVESQPAKICSVLDIVNYNKWFVEDL